MLIHLIGQSLLTVAPFSQSASVTHAAFTYQSNALIPWIEFSAHPIPQKRSPLIRRKLLTLEEVLNKKMYAKRKMQRISLDFEGTRPTRVLARIRERSRNNLESEKLYSLMKLGDRKAIESATIHLAHLIQKVIPDLYESPTVVAYVCWRLPNTASILGFELVLTLGLRERELQAIPQSQNDTHYASQQSSEARERSVNDVRVRDNVEGMRVILIDDALVSGVAMRRAEAALLEAGATRVHPFAIAHLDGDGDHSYEERVNQRALDLTDAKQLATRLDPKNVIYTHQLMRYILNLPDDIFDHLVSELTPRVLYNLFICGVVFWRSEMPPRLDTLRPHLNRQLGWLPPTAQQLNTDPLLWNLIRALSDLTHPLHLHSEQLPLSTLEYVQTLFSNVRGEWHSSIEPLSENSVLGAA